MEIRGNPRRDMNDHDESFRTAKHLSVLGVGLSGRKNLKAEKYHLKRSLSPLLVGGLSQVTLGQNATDQLSHLLPLPAAACRDRVDRAHSQASMCCTFRYSLSGCRRHRSILFLFTPSFVIAQCVTYGRTAVVFLSVVRHMLLCSL